MKILSYSFIPFEFILTFLSYFPCCCPSYRLQFSVFSNDIVAQYDVPSAKALPVNFVFRSVSSTEASSTLTKTSRRQLLRKNPMFSSIPSPSRSSKKFAKSSCHSVRSFRMSSQLMRRFSPSSLSSLAPLKALFLASTWLFVQLSSLHSMSCSYVAISQKADKNTTIYTDFISSHFLKEENESVSNPIV